MKNIIDRRFTAKQIITMLELGMGGNQLYQIISDNILDGFEEEIVKYKADDKCDLLIEFDIRFKNADLDNPRNKGLKLMKATKGEIKKKLIDYIYLTHQSTYTPMRARDHNYAYINALCDYRIISGDIHIELKKLNEELYKKREEGGIIITYKGATYHSG